MTPTVNELHTHIFVNAVGTNEHFYLSYPLPAAVYHGRVFRTSDATQ